MAKQRWSSVPDAPRNLWLDPRGRKGSSSSSSSSEGGKRLEVTSEEHALFVKHIQQLGLQGRFGEVLDAMAARPRAPGDADAFAFTAAINAMRRGHRWADALRLLRSMQAAGTRPNAFNYAAAVRACEGHGTVAARRAMDLLAEVRQLPSRRSRNWARVYNMAMLVAGAAGDLAGIESVLEALREDGVGPSRASYAVAARAAVLAGDAGAALSALRRATAFAEYEGSSAQNFGGGGGGRGGDGGSGSMDARTGTAAAAEHGGGDGGSGGSGGGGGGDGVSNIFSDMGYDLHMLVEGFAATICALQAVGRDNDARALLSQAAAGPPRFAVAVQSATAAACAQRGDADGALALLAALHARGAAAAAPAYAAVLAALAARGDAAAAARVLADMAAVGVERTEYHDTSYIAALGAAGEWQRALEVLEQVKQPLRASAHAAAVHACARCGRWEEGLTLLRSARARGLPPDYVTLSIALNAADAAGRADVADTLYAEMLANDIVQLWIVATRAPPLVDLHNHSRPMARAAVRHILRTMTATLPPATASMSFGKPGGGGRGGTAVLRSQGNSDSAGAGAAAAGGSDMGDIDSDVAGSSDNTDAGASDSDDADGSNSDGDVNGARSDGEVSSWRTLARGAKQPAHTRARDARSGGGGGAAAPLWWVRAPPSAAAGQRAAPPPAAAHAHYVRHPLRIIIGQGRRRIERRLALNARRVGMAAAAAAATAEEEDEAQFERTLRTAVSAELAAMGVQCVSNRSNAGVITVPSHELVRYVAARDRAAATAAAAPAAAAAAEAVPAAAAAAAEAAAAAAAAACSGAARA